MVTKCKLSTLLKEKNKPLYWLEKNSGVSYSTLNTYEKNRAKRYDSKVLAKIGKALNCKIEDILEIK